MPGRSLFFILLLALNSVATATSDSAISTEDVRPDPFANIKATFEKSKKIYFPKHVVAMNQLDTNSSTYKNDSAAAPAENRFGLTLQTGYSQNLYDKQDGSREKSWDFLVSPSYQITENYRTSILVTGSTDVNRQDGSDFGRGQISISRKPWELISIQNKLKTWSFFPSLALNLPASKIARDNQSYLLGLNPSIRISPSAEMLSARNWDASFSLSASRNFHTYELAKDGSSNAKYGSAQSLVLGYTLRKQFRLEISGAHYNTWTYEGTSTESYSHAEEIGWQVNSNWSAALGHSYGSPSVNIYGPDGQSLNYGLVSEKYSYAYTNLTYTY